MATNNKKRLNFIRKCIFFLSFICIATSVHCESKLLFNTINIEQGLSNNIVTVIFKDHRGFIWLGTELGLNRFDGINVDTYQAFGNTNISSICETDSIKLWIGHSNGLKSMDLKTGKVDDILLDKNKTVAVKFLRKKDSSLFIGTNNGLYIRKPSGIEHILTKVVSEKAILTDIVFDRQGNSWISSSEGLIFIDAKTKQQKRFIYSETTDNMNNFNCLAVLNDILFIGSDNAGLLQFDTKDKKFRSFSNIASNCVMSLTLKNDKLYVGTNGAGLKLISLATNTVESILHNPNDLKTISSNTIYSFLLDNNNYWVGTHSAGLSYSYSAKNIFNVYPLLGKMDPKSLNARSFWLIDKTSKLIGTREGLIYVDEKSNTVKQFNVSNSQALTSDIILTIRPWNNQFLIGTYAGGLYSFDRAKSTVSFFSQHPLFTNNSFYGIVQDSEQQLWFATLNGVICYNPNTQKTEHFTTSNSKLSNNLVYSIFRDSKKRIWLGLGDGVNVYDETTKTIQNDVLPQTLRTYLKMIVDIYEDKEGNIWFGSKNSLICFNPITNQYVRYTTSEFLPDETVTSIIEDDWNNMWISTLKGLVRFNRKTGNYSIFSPNASAATTQFNICVQKDENGTLWWGSTRGLLYMHPQKDFNNFAPKKIEITGIYIGGQTKKTENYSLPFTPEYTNKVTLNASEKNISIRFSNLNYGFTANDIFEYKVEGIDNDTIWHKLIGENTVTLSDLKSGKYKLHIRNAGSQEETKTIEIIKQKSYTGFIFAGILIVLIALAIVLYNTQLFKLKSLKQAIETAKLSASNKEDKEKYQNRKLEDNEILEIQSALTKYMEEAKPYMNVKLKLSDVSQAINCQQSKISQVLNLNLDTNFTDFVNKYRIEAFKERVLEDKNILEKYTLSALAEQCGFNSRSTFFNVFKKITGQTPSEFLKQAEESDKSTEE